MISIHISEGFRFLCGFDSFLITVLQGIFRFLVVKFLCVYHIFLVYNRNIFI